MIDVTSDSGNELSPVRHQAVPCTNIDLSSIALQDQNSMKFE